MLRISDLLVYSTPWVSTLSSSEKLTQKDIMVCHYYIEQHRNAFFSTFVLYVNRPVMPSTRNAGTILLSKRRKCFETIGCSNPYHEYSPRHDPSSGSAFYPVVITFEPSGMVLLDCYKVCTVSSIQPQH